MATQKPRRRRSKSQTETTTPPSPQTKSIVQPQEEPAQKKAPKAEAGDGSRATRKPRRRRRSKSQAKPPAQPLPEASSEAHPQEESAQKTAPKAKADDGSGATRKPRRSHRSKSQAKPPTQPSPEEESNVEPQEEPPQQTTPEPEAGTGFGAMGLSEAMLKALRKADYQEPTPVQAGLIPRAMAGEDLMGQARTGTGKTAAFAVPILEQLESRKRGAPPQALILAPTRELAVQVRDECSKLAMGRRVSVVAVYGGKPIRQQTEQLKRAAEIVVGTPGRVLDLMDRTALVLDQLRMVVLDEADRMLDIGFRPDIEKILRRCPQSRQTLLLSATIPPPVMRLARRYMRDPQVLDFSPKDPAVETIEQFYFTVDPERKFDLLVELLRREDPTQAIIFCRTKRGTDRIQRRLARRVRGVDTIHGDLAQSARDRVMRQFRDGNVRYLVATDVVGRGIDVTRISHIINYDIPQFCDDYIHRVGRTGRMGREGVAYTFVTPEEGNELTRIEMRINRLLVRDEIQGFVTFGRQVSTAATEPSPEEPPEPPKPKPIFGRRTRRIRRAL